MYRACYDFVNELSSVYMDVTKDRLYSESPDSPRRRAVQTVLMNILEVLVRVLAPVLSFTCDEVWEFFPEALHRGADWPTSVQLAGWPHREDFYPPLPADDGKADMQAFAHALAAREVVTKALEDARAEGFVKKSQEAAVKVTAPSDELGLLSEFGEQVLEELFIVSGVKLEQGDELSCEVLHADGEKCPRCWNYRNLGGNANHPDVCERCGDTLDAIGFAE